MQPMRHLTVEEAREVAYLYEAALNRSALDLSSDPDGLAFWIDQRQVGISAIALSREFIRSPEFRALAAAFVEVETGGAQRPELTRESVFDPAVLSDTLFVRFLYRNVFNRDADDAGLGFWLGRLGALNADPAQAPTARELMLLTFAGSDENQRGASAVLDLVETEPFRWTVAPPLEIALGPGDAAQFFSERSELIRAGPGNDTVDGRGGNDILLGEDGDDDLRGGLGADRLEGGPGRDALDGGPWADTLEGGTGADLFIVSEDPRRPGRADPGLDLIVDFLPTDRDRLDLSQIQANAGVAELRSLLSFETAGADTVVRVGDVAAFRIADFTDTPDGWLSQRIKATERPGANTQLEPFAFSNVSNTTADPEITPDGQFVAFVSKAYAGDGTGDIDPQTDENFANMDVFLWNVFTDAQQLVSSDAGGRVLTNGEGTPAVAFSPAVSDDGRFVAFAAGFGQPFDFDVLDPTAVYVRDMADPAAGPVALIDSDGTAVPGVALDIATAERANFSTESQQIVQISADGRTVAYAASEGDPLAANIYVQPASGGAPQLVSIGSAGVGAPRADFPVAGTFDDTDDNPLVSDAFRGYLNGFDMSASADRFVFATDRKLTVDDTDGGQFDVYLRDLTSGTTVLLSGGIADAGHFVNPVLSADGRTAAFVTPTEPVDPSDPDDARAYVVALGPDAGGASPSVGAALTVARPGADVTNPVLSDAGSALAVTVGELGALGEIDIEILDTATGSTFAGLTGQAMTAGGNRTTSYDLAEGENGLRIAARLIDPEAIGDTPFADLADLIEVFDVDLL